MHAVVAGVCLALSHILVAAGLFCILYPEAKNRIDETQDLRRKKLAVPVKIDVRVAALGYTAGVLVESWTCLASTLRDHVLFNQEGAD